MPAWARPGLLAAACALALGAAPATAQVTDLVSQHTLRVCSDPGNMPFSNREEEGFENEIAELLGARLNRPVSYTWFPQAIGFVRRTLAEGRCDVIIGFAQGHELVLNSNHYYVSAYVLVTKADGPLAGVDALSDPLLKGKTIGVVAGSPPATHMARYGLIGDVRPYRLMVDRRHESPTEEMIAHLVEGKTDAVVIWGPIGGYFAKEADAGLTVTPLLKEEGPPRLFYRITMGVRQGELEWKRELNSLLRRNADEIEAILRRYGVPLVDDYGEAVLEP